MARQDRRERIVTTYTWDNEALQPTLTRKKYTSSGYQAAKITYNDGLGDLYKKIGTLNGTEREGHVRIAVDSWSLSNNSVFSNSYQNYRYYSIGSTYYLRFSSSDNSTAEFVSNSADISTDNWNWPDPSSVKFQRYTRHETKEEYYVWMYMITFKDGSTTLSSTEVEQNNKVSRPSNPSKEGWTFEGWYTDSTFTTEFNFNTNINSDTTIYAKFSHNPTHGLVTLEQLETYILPKIQKAIDNDYGHPYSIMRPYDSGGRGRLSKLDLPTNKNNLIIRLDYQYVYEDGQIKDTGQEIIVGTGDAYFLVGIGEGLTLSGSYGGTNFTTSINLKDVVGNNRFILEMAPSGLTIFDINNNILAQELYDLECTTYVNGIYAIMAGKDAFRLYSIKVYTEDNLGNRTLITNYFPAIKQNSGEVGIADLFSNTFRASQAGAGEGRFIPEYGGD